MSLMVKVAARGNDPGGLIDYLANNQNHHENQRIVAGTVNYSGPLDKQLVAQVAADLRHNQQVTGTVSAKGHIYHAALSVSPDNGLLSDARWAAIANDFMVGMRFAAPGQSPVRWTAINHGANGAGADHIHIVMSTIRQNGTQVSLHNDMVRASVLATKLESKYALGVLESRLALVGAGSVPFTGKEVQRAREQSKPEPDRVRLERDIRVLSAAASSEAEFVRLVKADGLLIAPFPRTSGAVTGYSVALPVPVGQRVEWFGGGKLATDLTLPQLRRAWPTVSGGTAAALAEWRGVRSPGESPLPQAVAETATSEEQVRAGLDAVGEQLADAETPIQMADASHDLAATLATASRALETTPGPLARASREVGAWAQPTILPTAPMTISRAQIRLLIQSLDPSSEKGQQIMLAQFAQMFIELHRLHQARRLVAAGGRRTTMHDDANPAAELMDDGTTVGMTAGALTISQRARSRRHQVEQGEQVRERPSRWDAGTFREIRRAERAQRETLRPSSPTYIPPQPAAFNRPRSTPEQQARLRELSELVGLPLTEDTLAAVYRDDAAVMINDFERAAQEWNVSVPEALPDLGVSSATAVGPITTTDQADAFMAGLERSAEQRQAQGFASLEEQLADWQNNVVEPTAPEVSAVPAWKLDRKDPRNWDTAQEPVSKPQQYRLAEAGFSAPEIQALGGKGEASVVIAAIKADPTTARTTYDRVLAEAILDTTDAPAQQARPTRIAAPPTPTTKATPTAAEIAKKQQYPKQ